MGEKSFPPPRSFSAVGLCLTAIRVWQWSSSFFVYASFSLLYDHIQRNRLGENDRIRGVQVLGLVSLVYSTAVVCFVHVFRILGLRTWRFFAIMTLPADLTVMGINLAKITILSYSGLPADCHRLTRDNYDANDLIRQPADGFTTIRFGSLTQEAAAELDSLCSFPRTVYGLSAVAIFSFTFSILLSVLYLQQHPAANRVANEKFSDATEHVGDSPPSRSHHSPSRPPPPPSIYSAATSHQSRGSHRYSEWVQVPPQDAAPSNNCTNSCSRTQSVASTLASRGSMWDMTTLAGSGDGESIRSGISLSDTESLISGGSLPPAPLPGSSSTPQRRWSTSTSSSFNAEAFIITDGFRPADNHPPAYSSRPGSLYHETVKYEAGLGLPNGPVP